MLIKKGRSKKEINAQVLSVWVEKGWEVVDLAPKEEAPKGKAKK